MKCCTCVTHQIIMEDIVEMEEDIPYCIYDTLECEDCGFCDPSPLAEWEDRNKCLKKDIKKKKE